MITGAIAGPKLSGKTTLAKHICGVYWREHGIRSLALDIYLNEPGAKPWPVGCYPVKNEAKFWAIARGTRNMLVVIDEATVTIDRDREFTDVFTGWRHQGHTVICVCHDASSLLPVMRSAVDTLYLFKQCRDSAEEWSKRLMQRGFLEAENLNQYEFLYGETFKAPVKQKM